MKRAIVYRKLPIACVLLLPLAAAAAPDRITRTVDAGRTRTVAGARHRLAQPQFDRGAVDPAMEMNYLTLLVRPSATQQAEMERLLADQQNPASPLFHRWLTPEEYGDRFGLSAGDVARVEAWLRSQNLTVEATARGRNWIAFSGNAGQVSRALHTPIHRFQKDGETHFANTADPAVPEALADVVAGFLGLNDFYLKSMAVPVPPDYTAGATHFLTPADFTTIYDLAPLYQAGIDGSGQSIAVVGESGVLLSDLQAFRKRYQLPPHDPVLIPYTGTDPGINGAQVEGNLDLEWAGAIAPSATVYYVYGPNPFTAIVSAVNLDVAPVISVSYGACEIDFSDTYYRSIAQQANAQGITILAASGDSGAAGCDSQESEPLATRGRMVDFPAVLPEVTGVGGTQFVEGGGNYWSPTNSAAYGSALSYIPEAAWNESSTAGLGSGGGGASQFYAKPGWQSGPGVPADAARDVPDVALSAAVHDAYFITYQGLNAGVGGTSASAPSMAGLIALLNQYQVMNGFQAQPGLGNINPQLYRLSQSAPNGFHDITAGNNIAACAQASPDCLTGSFGYAAGPGYDLATGLGSVDANLLVTQWHAQTSGVTVTLSVNAPQVTMNDTITATATVAAAAGAGTPTGSVSFNASGVALGSVALAASGGQNTAVLAFPAALAGPGGFVLTAIYSGDGTFSNGGATQTIRVSIPSQVTSLLVSGPNTVWPNQDALGLSWQASFTLREMGGAPGLITGFTIDGTSQPLAQYFPSTEITANGALTTTVVFRNLAAPLTRTFAFTGTDAAGQPWTRQLAVRFFPLPPGTRFSLTATPPVVTGNAANSSCPWAVLLHVSDLGGYLTLINALRVGGVDLSAQIPAIFGTTRLDAWGDVQGTVCFSGLTTPASDTILVTLSGLSQQTNVVFVATPSNAATLGAAPASISLAATATQPGQAVLNVSLGDATQPWTASIFPANRSTAWLSASRLSGTGPGPITLTASGAGFEPGVYRATIVLQSPNAVPQTVSVPVMFVLGGSSTTSIAAAVNAATYKATASAGMILSVFGANLANTTAFGSGSPIAFSTAGVSATVNGLAAPVLFASSNQLNVLVPYEAGAGPGVLGVNNNGQIAGFPLQISAAAPGIFADGNGNLAPIATAAAGDTVTLYVTGTGDVTPALKTAYAPAAALPAALLPRPAQPLSVAVGGAPVLLQSVALAPGQFGVTKVTFTLPASIPLGPQPVVVTVGGSASPPVNLTVQAAVLSTMVVP